MCTDFSRRAFRACEKCPLACVSLVVVLATRRVAARSLKTRCNFRLKPVHIRKHSSMSCVAGASHRLSVYSIDAWSSISGGRSAFRGEESPDSAGQDVPLQSGIPRTIRRGKASATERIPPSDALAKEGKGEMVG